ncbi:C2H2-type zinc finger protein [Aspergillus novofumigatus IBT 16806]|uniref:C2H2-type domain-containing protein n=1 Tax=Aspergillus novofumigatus (strain IBT 16806) TaxID=1392255 RepID=A0A2I1BVG2_ASPN1|nr:uncharacterized protein P174DRAFT_57399 [Aspergillus novofumigatus IBT 16806]PKX89377.1 hypothetical protein P174DRAFT_57399 [Aspergillus novofumigatus IBT 16806]
MASLLEPSAEANGKQFICAFCQREFRRLEHLQRHTRRHTNEKPFSCSCGPLFSRRDLLRRHERIEHGSIENSSRQLYTQFTANSVKACTENTRTSASQRREILLEGGTALRSDLTSSQPYHLPSQIRCTQHRRRLADWEQVDRDGRGNGAEQSLPGGISSAESPSYADRPDGIPVVQVATPGSTSTPHQLPQASYQHSAVLPVPQIILGQSRCRRQRL